MAGTSPILKRLCDLEKTNFEVVDVKVKSDEIVWRIEHQEKTDIHVLVVSAP